MSAAGAAARQTLAILLDAYRELNSKRMFWIVLAISGLVVIALGLPSNNEKGIGIFGMTVDLPFLSTRAVSSAGFYKFLLFWIGNNLWLTWGATILALISTASMIPDLLTGGSIDLMLSKPIGRVRLFLTKYASGLLFVATQAAVFAVGAVLLVGIRAGSLDLKPLLVIPLVTLFYSYIYCICALVGLVTRSTLAALLTTLIVWLGIYALTTVENVLLDQRLQRESQVARIENQLKSIGTAAMMIDERLATLAPPAGEPETVTRPDEPGATTPTDQPASAGEFNNRRDPGRRGPRRGQGLRDLLDSGRAMLEVGGEMGDAAALKKRRASLDVQRERLEGELVERRESMENGRRWHRYFLVASAVLPKTGETKRLFQRYVVEKDDLEGFLKLLAEQTNEPDSRALEDALNRRGLGWILGTSLLFEAVVLGIACFIFARRDF